MGQESGETGLIALGSSVPCGSQPTPWLLAPAFASKGLCLVASTEHCLLSPESTGVGYPDGLPQCLHDPMVHEEAAGAGGDADRTVGVGSGHGSGSPEFWREHQEDE